MYVVLVSMQHFDFDNDLEIILEILFIRVVLCLRGYWEGKIFVYKLLNCNHL